MKNLAKFISLIIIAMLLIGAVGIFTVSALLPPPIARIYVDPPLYEATALNEEFTVDIVLEDVADLYGWEVKLFWDNSLLECIAEEYPFLPPGLHWESPNSLWLGPGIEQNYNATHGRWYHGLSALPIVAPFPVPFTGTIKLVTLTFRAKAAGSCNLTLLDGALRGQDTSATTVYPRWSDINNDGFVDIFDVVKLAGAFGSRPGDPKWNQAADLDDNGKVDITDVVIVASDFGKYAGGPLWGVTYTVYDIPATLQGARFVLRMPVGGVWTPINKLDLLAPWIGLASLITAAAVSVGYVKRRKKKQT